jgi:hypothetical protein
VVHDVARPAPQIAEALRAVGGEEATNEVLGVRVNVRWEGHLVAQDLLVDPQGVVVKEGRVAGEHLEGEDAKRPPVDGLAVPLRQHNLGCEVLGRAAQCEGTVLDDLGEAKVCDAQITAAVK